MNLRRLQLLDLCSSPTLFGCKAAFSHYTCYFTTEPLNEYYQILLYAGLRFIPLRTPGGQRTSHAGLFVKIKLETLRHKEAFTRVQHSVEYETKSDQSSSAYLSDSVDVVCVHQTESLQLITKTSEGTVKNDCPSSRSDIQHGAITVSDVNNKAANKCNDDDGDDDDA